MQERRDWELDIGKNTALCVRVVCTTPAPQTSCMVLDLFISDHSDGRELSILDRLCA